MNDSAALISELRRMAAVGVRPSNPTGTDDWFGAGLPGAQVHELFATAADVASVAGFAVALALAGKAAPMIWLRTLGAERQGGRLHATGLRELGLDPDLLVMVVVPDEATLLRAAGDVARCPGLGLMIIETWGNAPGLDLTATRRLQLAAEQSGITTLLLRIGGVAVPSAAATRWGVAACPSTALEADAPGRPAFQIELQRRRGGPSGQRWRVEWDRDTQSFDATPLPGTDFPLALDRTPAVDAATPVRRSG